MSIYNLFLKDFVLPIGDAFFGSYYMKYLKKWKYLDGLSEKELETIQSEKLKKILNHAIHTVPFYKSQSYKSLTDFPILTKDILRNHKEELISSEYNIEKLDKHHSSGSTGVQSFTYMSKEHTFYLRALQTHWWNWSGYELGDNLVQFGISQKRSLLKKLKDFFFRCNYNKAFGLSHNDLENILKKTRLKKDIYIAGYPSVINQLALAELNLKSKLDINGIVCFGDKLFQHYKKNIQEAFGASKPIIDTYGCAEGLLMACKRDLEYYYIMSPHVVIELVDGQGKPVKDGEMGHVLVTCLTNKAMPLIRYKLGDLAIKLPKEKYPENRLLNYPLLQKIIGRETDIIKTLEGITLNVHSFTGVLEYFQEIKQYKVIQNNLESIIIQYIPESNFNESDLEEIKNKLASLTNNCLKIYFEKVSYIAPTKSGKPQIIESNLDNS